MIRFTKAPMLKTPTLGTGAAAALAFGLLGGTSLCGTGASAATLSNVTVAFLMPDQGSTRYEEHDHPGFVAEMKKLCPSCKVLYQNADGDASRQQQQFNSVVSQGAKAIVLDPVEFDRRGLPGPSGPGPGHQGDCLRPADPLGAGQLLRLLQQRGDRQDDR